MILHWLFSKNIFLRYVDDHSFLLVFFLLSNGFSFSCCKCVLRIIYHWNYLVFLSCCSSSNKVLSHMIYRIFSLFFYPHGINFFLMLNIAADVKHLFFHLSVFLHLLLFKLLLANKCLFFLFNIYCQWYWSIIFFFSFLHFFSSITYLS